MEIDTNKIKTIENALRNAHSFLYGELDAICDEDYMEEVERLMEELKVALDILKEE